MCPNHVTAANTSGLLTQPAPLPKEMLPQFSLLVTVTTEPEINVLTWELFVRKRTVPITLNLGDIRAVLLGNYPGSRHSNLTWDLPISGKQEHPGSMMTSKDFLEKLDLKIFSKFSLYLAVLGLHCCAWAFSSCGVWGFSLQWLLLLKSMVSSAPRLQQLWLVGSTVVARKLSCRSACGIFPDQGSNPCPLHWQADS